MLFQDLDQIMRYRTKRWHITAARKDLTTLKSWNLTFKKIFAKLKFSPDLLKKVSSFVCLVFKIENK